jgi:hypothetical protein
VFTLPEVADVLRPFREEGKKIRGVGFETRIIVHYFLPMKNRILRATIA